ncbi:protein piccolo-like isoform X2 [Salarias fasciatus]|uniref:protein piccolo-like isoform X2 n=1 Tax=Salarias fasciatus TaxID=181472 RepID=UPI001176C9E9|nr:protein piccolo-like isoform X2 [Salarias fasciatus]
MREDAMENGLREDQHVETETASGERRSSVAALENMLKKVSQSPLQHEHTNGMNGASTRMNPFYDYYLSGSNGYQSHDGGTTSSQDVEVDYIVEPPSEFQSSPPEAEVQMTANAFSEPEVQTLTLDQNVIPNGHVEDFSAGKMEDIFAKVDPFKPLLNNEEDLFQSAHPAKGNPFFTAATVTEAELFQSSPAENGQLDLDGGSKQKPQTHQRDLFEPISGRKVNVFSTSSTDSVDPFQSPFTKNLFQDVSGLDDPFGSTPSKAHTPFDQSSSNGTPDIFKPLSSDGIFETTPSNAAEVTPSPDIFKKKPTVPPPVPPKPFKTPPATVLTTPGGTEHEIFQPTPFSRARNLAMSSSRSPASMMHAQTTKRPPKPLPRTKPPKPERPPQPTIPAEPEPNEPKVPPKPLFKPLPKPVIRTKPKTPEMKKVESENFVVFEDILLIGQERCVEDWPEDSPEVNPDFKPSGTLKLRRESLKSKMDLEGTTGEEQDGSGSYQKRKDKKFRMSLLSRRDSKEKFPDDMEARSRTLPIPRKSSKDYFSDFQTSFGETEDGEQMDYKKKPLKSKVNQLLRRASTNSFGLGGKQGNELSSQDDGLDKKSISKKGSVRRWSEGTALEGSTGEEEDGGDGHQDEKRQKKLKIKFVPRRGFTISADKTSEGPKGATGYTPRKSSKDKAHDESFGASGTYTARKKSQDAMLDDTLAQKMKSASSAEELDEELFRTEDYKLQSKLKNKAKADEADGFDDDGPQYADEFDDDEPTGKDFSREMDDSEQDEVDTYKPKKHLKLKGFKKRKSKSKVMDVDSDFPPGATSSDYLSEAARAEWQAAQMDERAKEGMEDEDEEEEGDTDSLMEWWYTVEQWDEVPSDEEDQILKEDESKSFSILADKVSRGLRVFNKVFTERAEVLWQSIITLCAIADDLSDFHQKAKIAGITGGTTTAVGGVTAIAGLALAPFTLGISLVITAVGVGVATAGGITSASAAISDNVNNANDKKKVEVVLQDYEGHLLDIGKILHFINTGVYKLRGHPFLRSGTQHYSEDWETRRAVQMISLVDSPVMRATEITDAAVAMLQGLFKGMDKYFLKDSRELKKGCRKEIVAQIREVANVLNDTIVDLNAIREELQESTGNI